MEPEVLDQGIEQAPCSPIPHGTLRWRPETLGKANGIPYTGHPRLLDLCLACEQSGLLKASGALGAGLAICFSRSPLTGSRFGAVRGLVVTRRLEECL